MAKTSLKAAANVKTAGRTLDLFEAFAAARKPLNLSDIARAVQMPISSCFGLARTLERRGYLYSIGLRRRFYPTKRLLEMARVIAANDPLAERVTPALTGLRDRTGETVLLAQRQGDAIVYLDVIEGLHSVRYAARIGDFKPLHSSSIGKAMLGRLGEAELDSLLEILPLPKVTPNTITDPVALKADLMEGRRRGWYLTRGENVADVMAIATTAQVGDTVYGICVAGPFPRMEANLQRLAEELLKARDAIEGEE
jgi:DNA-binding IclR family transcriptional regulator